jgi:hypothetical protein
VDQPHRWCVRSRVSRRHLVPKHSLAVMPRPEGLQVCRFVATRTVPWRSRPHPLRDHFPKSWLNIFDPKDFLSHVGGKVFGDCRVMDVEVDNKEPFPESHGAYWANAEVWNAITVRLKGEA